MRTRPRRNTDVMNSVDYFQKGRALLRRAARNFFYVCSRECEKLVMIARNNSISKFQKQIYENPLFHFLLNTPREDGPDRPPQVGPIWQERFEQRLAVRLSRLAQADLSAPFQDNNPTFSIITTVYDTNPTFIKALAESILKQAFKDFEWLILDNGSMSNASSKACAEIASGDKRFKLFRVETNLHIIGGNRYVFDRAKGRYIVPVDSDDLLYGDSLALIADVLRQEALEPPDLIYSDEQRIDEKGEPIDLFGRRDFSMALAISTVPAAHLLVFPRDKGIEVGVYSNDYAKGSHDWDTALRIGELGGKHRHIPEVLYGWRVHEGSTASSVHAKSYIKQSQNDVQMHSLIRRGLINEFEIEPLIDGGVGWYKLRRRHLGAPSISIDFVANEGAEGIRATERNIRVLSGTPAFRRVLYPSSMSNAISELRNVKTLNSQIDEWVSFDMPSQMLRHINKIESNTFAKVIVDSLITLRHADAVWQAIGVLEVDPSAGVVGGILYRKNGRVFGAGMLARLDGIAGYPFHDWRSDMLPRHLVDIWTPVTGFPTFALCVRGNLLRSNCMLSGLDRSDARHGLDFCLRARKLGFSSILESRFSGTIEIDFLHRAIADESEEMRMLTEYREELAATSYSSYFSGEGKRFNEIC